jgi:hypothetical protein
MDGRSLTRAFVKFVLIHLIRTEKMRLSKSEIAISKQVSTEVWGGNTYLFVWIKN